MRIDAAAKTIAYWVRKPELVKSTDVEPVTMPETALITEAAACAQSCAMDPTGSLSREPVEVPPPFPPPDPFTSFPVLSQACFIGPISREQGSAAAAWIALWRGDAPATSAA